jgi:8-oxo-dGTP pyrophosphatase MutT (NUDIX family)
VRERREQPLFKLGAGVYVVSPDDRILLVDQERLGQRHWTSLGGGIEHGESIEQCAIREAYEESGLRVRLERLLTVTEFWKGAALHGVGFLFLATPDPWPQDVVLPDVDGIATFHGYGWFSREDVARLDVFPGELCLEIWPADIKDVLRLREDE